MESGADPVIGEIRRAFAPTPRSRGEDEEEHRREIDQALDEFWFERAPTAAALEAHIVEEQAFTDAILRRRDR